MEGIQYERLKLTLSASNSYKKAAELGLPVAAANLFYLYLNAPHYALVFPEEVEQLLERYKDQKSSDSPNILSALSDIRRFRDKEYDDELKHLKDARKIQNFLSLFADEYFIEDPLRTNALSGLWYLEKKDRNKVLRISSEQSQIKAVLTIDSDTRNFFVGQKANQAAIVDFLDENVGYAYLSLDAQRLHIMRLHGCEPFFFLFTRNDVTHA